jgi:glycosyltransferase involved in cell wall biosynthesis
MESREAVRARLDISLDAPVVAYLGGTSRIKGVVTLLSAIEEVLQSRDDVRFLLVGCQTAPPRSRLRRVLMALLPLAGSTVNPSWFRRRSAHLSYAIRTTEVQHDTASLLNAADLLVFPSTVRHFGRPIVEAHVLGKPAVASDFGEAREVITDGVTGYLVPPKQPRPLAARILDLVNDPALRDRMGREAQRRTGQLFAREVNLARLISAYEIALASREVGGEP